MAWKFPRTAVNISCYHSGMYTDGASSEEQSFFVTERNCFSDLVEGLGTPCPCGMMRAPWVLESVVQVHKINVEYRVSVFISMLTKHYPRKDMLSELFSVVVAVDSKDVHGLVPVCLQGIT